MGCSGFAFFGFTFYDHRFNWTDTYTHFMGDEFNWLRLLAMCLFGPLLGMLVLGIVFRGTIPLETSKDVFFLWLFSFIFIVLLFVLPSFLLLFVSDVLI